MGVIEDFVNQYKKEYDYFDTVSNMVAKKIEEALYASGIKAIVSSRAKNPDHLLEKLRQRNEKRKPPYKNFDEIYNDICDLSGVRVALYFPSDRNKVDKIIEKLFSPSIQQKIFPSDAKTPSYEKRFSGYWAQHYRVQLQDKDLHDDQKRYSQAKTEIQVASLLMHAWAEVEHDLVYKPLSGKLSEEEYAILDELNGLVMAGEIALERLQVAGEKRVLEQKEINDPYELSSFLSNKFNKNIKDNNIPLGNMNLLYELLKNSYSASIPTNSPYLKNLLDSNINQSAISDQMIDNYILGNSSRYKILSELKSNPYRENKIYNSYFDDFINQWVKIETLIIEKSKILNPNFKNVFSQNNLEKLFSKNEVEQICRLRRIRDRIIHENESLSLPEMKMLVEDAKRLFMFLSRE